MIIKEHNKLVRDKIPEKIEKNGEYAKTKILSSNEYEILLFEKLIEEAEEVISTKTQSELIEELGDLLEVINGIVKYKNIDPKKIEKKRLEKKKKLGGFDKGVYLIETYDQEYIDSKKGCLTCQNGSCKVETSEKVGYEDDGYPKGHNCIGYKSSYTKKPL